MQTSSRLSPLSGATGSASPGVPRRRGWRLLAPTSMTRPYSFWPRRDPDLAGPRPASWRPCSSAALTTSTWARAAAIPSRLVDDILAMKGTRIGDAPILTFPLTGRDSLLP